MVNGLSVDYTGSSEASLYGINVVENFCIAYTVFGVNCVIGPQYTLQCRIDRCHLSLGAEGLDLER